MTWDAFAYLRALRRATQLGGHDKAVAVWLMSYADEGGRARPGLDTIAEVSGFSRATVCRALDRLRDLGWVEIERSGRNVTNRYRLMIPTTAVAREIPAPTSSAPQLPAPPAAPKVVAKTQSPSRGARIPRDWHPSASTMEWCESAGVDGAAVVPEFVDHWIAEPGAKGTKLDWDATFKNRVRMLIEQGRAPKLAPREWAPNASPESKQADPAQAAEVQRAIADLTKSKSTKVLPFPKLMGKVNGGI